MTHSLSGTAQPANSARRILFASLIGTTIEFFDFYIYATAAALVFPRLFFPAGDPTSATLQSLATFAIAFIARPIGSAVFGHFGDRIGRKATLVAALLTMGISTVLIGLLPTYAHVGVLAPLLLALCRFGQGLGLGGEWGGAVLLATENAPPGRRAWYGMFPQLGAPIGLALASSIFLLLGRLMDDSQFFQFGWRIPFLASSLLVLFGLYMRLKLSETPAFRAAIANNERVRLPMLTVIVEHTGALVTGTLAATATFVLFYLMTVFSLSWGTTALHFPRQQFLLLQLLAAVFFALTIPFSGVLSDRHNPQRILVWTSVGIALFGLALTPLFGSGHIAGALLYLVIGQSLMGFTYGPLGTLLAQLFPTPVRYTGSSLAFNFAGILGASLAPYVATWLATRYGLAYVGLYLAIAAVITLLAVIVSRRYARAD